MSRGSEPFAKPPPSIARDKAGRWYGSSVSRRKTCTRPRSNPVTQKHPANQGNRLGTGWDQVATVAVGNAVIAFYGASARQVGSLPEGKHNPQGPQRTKDVSSQRLSKPGTTSERAGTGGVRSVC